MPLSGNFDRLCVDDLGRTTGPIQRQTHQETYDLMGYAVAGRFVYSAYVVTVLPSSLNGIISFFCKCTLSKRTDCRADPAVVAVVILEVVLFFPVIACLYIKNFLAWKSWIPRLSL